MIKCRINGNRIKTVFRICSEIGIAQLYAMVRFIDEIVERGVYRCHMLVFCILGYSVIRAFCDWCVEYICDIQIKIVTQSIWMLGECVFLYTVVDT